LKKEGKSLRKLLDISELQRIPSKQKELGCIWRRKMEERKLLENEIKKTGVALSEFEIAEGGRRFKWKPIPVIVIRN
jgi:hypothetical protein